MYQNDFKLLKLRFVVHGAGKDTLRYVSPSIIITDEALMKNNCKDKSPS